MNLDFEKALTYVFKDPQWVNKLLAGTGLIYAILAVLLIPAAVFVFSDSAFVSGIVFLICYTVSFILSFALAGYIAETANKRINYQNSLLPDWSSFGQFIISGLKYFAGYFLYILPIIVLCLIFLFLTGMMIGSASFYTGAFNTVIFLLMTLMGALVLMCFILVTIFCPLMMSNYFKSLKTLAFVDFKGAFELLKNNAGNYFVIILLFIAMSILAQFVSSILIMTIAGVILIPFVYFYIYLVIAELCAQFVLSAKEKQQQD